MPSVSSQSGPSSPSASNSSLLYTSAPEEDGEESVSHKISAVSLQFPKPFLGGYRDKRNGQEYHHASTQTLVATRARKSRADCENKVSRRIQVTPSKSKSQQTSNESATQTDWKTDSHLKPRCKDKIITPSAEYVTAESYENMKTEKVVILQKTVRRWLKARNFFMAKDAMEVNDEAAKVASKAESIFEQPSLSQDFKKMMADLEAWKLGNETEIIEDPNSFRVRARNAKRVAEEALELAKAASAREKQRIDERHVLFKNLMLKAGQPRTWRQSNGSIMKVETPDTNKARLLAAVYMKLMAEADFEDEERFPTLQAIQDVVSSLPKSPDSKDISKLVQREVMLISTGVPRKNLVGLRKRIVMTYLRILRSPEFNPEIGRYEKLVPLIRPPRNGTASSAKVTEFCQSCRQHRPRSQFPLSSGAALGRCCRCEQLDNNARSRQDLTVYKTMIDDIKKSEEDQNNATSPIFQLQDSDIRYVVKSFWDSQSILSGNKELSELRLCRWNLLNEWAPWNCILLTKEEAKIHADVEDLAEVGNDQDSPDSLNAYGPLLIQRICHKHTLSRNHFSKLSSMSQQLKNEKGGDPSVGITNNNIDDGDNSLIMQGSTIKIIEKQEST